MPGKVGGSNGALWPGEVLATALSFSFTRRLGRSGAEMRPTSVPGNGVTGEEGIGVCGRDGIFFAGTRSTGLPGIRPGED